MQGKLFEVKGYPGIVESCNLVDKVHGELYLLPFNKRILTNLDKYEECTEAFPKPHEYVRKKQPVFTNNGRPVLAWVYNYNRETGGLSQIKSGNYLRYSRLRGIRA